MTEPRSEKLNIPGLSRVKSSPDDYKRSKSHEVNPTLSNAQEALPLVEKSVEFREHNAASISLPPWLTPEVVKNIVSYDYSSRINEENTGKVKPKRMTKPAKSIYADADKPVKPIEKSKKQEVPKEMPKAAAPKQPTDLEIALNSIPLSDDAGKKNNVLSETLNFASVELPSQKNSAPEINVFETINSLDIPEAEVSAVKNNNDELLKAKPFMVIDKVEVRIVNNSDDEPVYMIGKKEYSSKGFEEYMQGIQGKILAMDCKKLEFNDVTYIRQNNGTYKDSNNNILSADDMLNLFHA